MILQHFDHFFFPNQHPISPLKSRSMRIHQHTPANKICNFFPPAITTDAQNQTRSISASDIWNSTQIFHKPQPAQHWAQELRRQIGNHHRWLPRHQLSNRQSATSTPHTAVALAGLQIKSCSLLFTCVVVPFIHFYARHQQNDTRLEQQQTASATAAAVVIWCNHRTNQPIVDWAFGFVKIVQLVAMCALRHYGTDCAYYDAWWHGGGPKLPRLAIKSAIEREFINRPGTYNQIDSV